jgi:hypothetical protein
MGCLLLPAGRLKMFLYKCRRIVAEFIVATVRLLPLILLNQLSVFEFLHVTVTLLKF